MERLREDEHTLIRLAILAMLHKDVEWTPHEQKEAERLYNRLLNYDLALVDFGDD